PTSRSRGGHVTVRCRATPACRISSRPPATPGKRLHCSANQAEPNAASSLASSSPRQCGDVAASARTLRSCRPRSPFANRLESGSDICCLQNRPTDDFAATPLAVSNQRGGRAPVVKQELNHPILAERKFAFGGTPSVGRARKRTWPTDSIHSSFGVKSEILLEAAWRVQLVRCFARRCT